MKSDSITGIAVFFILTFSVFSQEVVHAPAIPPDANSISRSKELGNMALNDGIYILAEEYYREYKNDAKKAGDDESAVDASLKLLEVYCRNGKALTARKEYNELATGFPDLLRNDTNLSKRAEYWNCCVMILEQKPVLAVELLNALRKKLEPNDPLYLKTIDKIGLALVKQSKWAEAEKVYSMLADTGAGGSQTNDNARTCKNLCTFMKGDIEALKKIVDSKAETPVPMSSRIARLLLLIREKKLQEAVSFFDEQKEVIPNEDRNIWYFACMELARDLRMQKMNVEASKLLENARILSAFMDKSESEEPCLALIDVYSESGEQDKLVEICEYFRRNFPDSNRIFEVTLRLARLYSEKFDVKNVENMKDNYLLIINHRAAPLQFKLETVLEAADKLVEAKDYSSAKDLLSKHLPEMSENSLTRGMAEIILAQILFNEDKVAESMEKLQGLSKKYEKNPEIRKKALYLLALASYKNKDYGRTKDIILAFFKEFPEKDDKYTDLHIFLADSEYELGNKSQSVKIYSDYASLNTENTRTPEVLIKAASISMELRNFAEAEKFLDRIIADYQKSLFYDYALYNKIYVLMFSANREKLKTDMGPIMENLRGTELFFPSILAVVDFYSNKKEYGEATAVIDGILNSSNLPQNVQSQPESIKTAVPEPEKEVKGNAKKIVDKKTLTDFEKEWLSKLIYEKAYIQFKSGKMDDSLNSLNILFSEFPNSPVLAEAHYLHGDILSNNNDFEKATLSYKESGRIRPESEIGNAALARSAECLFTIRTDQKNLDEARLINMKLLEKGNLPAEFREHLQYNLGRCEEESGNKEAALSCYHRVITEYKNDALQRRIRDPIWLVRSANAAAKIYREKENPDAYEVAKRIYADLANTLKIEPVDEFKKEIKRYNDALTPK